MSLEGILPAACGITDTSEGSLSLRSRSKNVTLTYFFSQFLFVNPFMHVAAKLLDYLLVVSQIQVKGHCPSEVGLRMLLSHIFFSQFLFVNPFMHVAAKLLDYLLVVSQIQVKGHCPSEVGLRTLLSHFLFFFRNFSFMHVAAKLLYYLGDISLTKAISRTYLVNCCFIPQLVSKL